MHAALFYRDPDEYADGVLAFVRPALGEGEPVAIVVPESHGALLRERLSGHAAKIEMFDMAQVGRNPAWIIPAVQRMIDEHEGRMLHYVGEPIWAGRSEEEIREATRHEALINLAWPDGQIHFLCTYDTATLDEHVLADAELTHPQLIQGGERTDSAAYIGPQPPVGCEHPLPEPPPDALALAFDRDDLVSVRALVAHQARAAALDGDRASDLVLAVNELATNTIKHANGSGVVRAWHAADRVVCQVEDRGTIRDPLAGRRVPELDDPAGVELWIVNQVCDLVEVRTGEDGTVVRVHATLA